MVLLCKDDGQGLRGSSGVEHLPGILQGAWLRSLVPLKTKVFVKSGSLVSARRAGSELIGVCISPYILEKSMAPELLEMREEELSTMKVRVVAYSCVH